MPKETCPRVAKLHKVLRKPPNCLQNMPCLNSTILANFEIRPSPSSDGEAQVLTVHFICSEFGKGKPAQLTTRPKTKLCAARCCYSCCFGFVLIRFHTQPKELLKSNRSHLMPLAAGHSLQPAAGHSPQPAFFIPRRRAALKIQPAAGHSGHRRNSGNRASSLSISP